MRESIKSRYGNEILEKVFQYFMRTVLRLQDSGIEKLPLQNDFEEPLKSYLFPFSLPRREEARFILSKYT